jgi:hypothetical protein
MMNLSLLPESPSGLYSLSLSLNSRIHCLLYLPCCSHRRHHVEQLLCCPVGCHGTLVFRNLLSGNDSFAPICCNGNVICDPLLNNGRLALAQLFRLSVVTSQYAHLSNQYLRLDLWRLKVVRKRWEDRNP